MPHTPPMYVYALALAAPITLTVALTLAAALILTVALTVPPTPKLRGKNYVKDKKKIPAGLLASFIANPNPKIYRYRHLGQKTTVRVRIPKPFASIKIT